MDTVNVTIRLHAIEIVEKSFVAIPPQPDNQEYKFDFSAKAGIDPGQKLLVVLLELFLKKGDEPNVLAKLTTATAFQLPNLEQELPKAENGQYVIPGGLDYMVKSVSISTARGILYSELRGTPLHRALLPLIQLPAAHLLPAQEVPVPAN